MDGTPSTAGAASTSSDREATDIGTASVTATQAVNSEIQFALTTSKVQEWISGALANNGLVMQPDTEANDAYKFYAHDDATAGTRPKLVIQYAVPTSARIINFI